MHASITSLLTLNKSQVSTLCGNLLVRELRIFGSALGAKFNPATSDMDFVVEFFEPETPGIADRYMSLALGLERIFQRPVDLVTKQAMKNPIFRETVEKTSQSLYAA